MHIQKTFNCHIQGVVFFAGSNILAAYDALKAHVPAPFSHLLHSYSQVYRDIKRTGCYTLTLPNGSIFGIQRIEVKSKYTPPVNGKTATV